MLRKGVSTKCTPNKCSIEVSTLAYLQLCIIDIIVIQLHFIQSLAAVTLCSEQEMNTYWQSSNTETNNIHVIDLIPMHLALYNVHCSMAWL